MSLQNIQKILSGAKTSTLRTTDASFDIGLLKNETGLVKFGGVEFLITNLGSMYVSEAGGKEAICESEAFGESGPMFESTKRFLIGQCKLSVYRIKRNE